MGVQTTLVPFRFITMLGHFLAALLVFFSYVRAALLSLPSPRIRMPSLAAPPSCVAAG